MSAKLKIVCAVATGVAAAVASGCQTYDFEPVEPLAIAQTTQSKEVVSKQLKPNMMLLLDKSGSMNFAADPSASGCTGCGGPGAIPASCATTCPRTRMFDLRDAMRGFLTGDGATVARLGMVPYPSNTVCAATTITPFPVNGVELNQSPNDADADLRATATAINDKIQNAITPAGGTPTGASLQALGTYDKLLGDDGRLDFILLLTDGAPNCNEAYDRNTCVCTAATTPCGGVGTNQCLDKQGVIDAVTSLKSKGIKTIVVGFGAEAAASTGDAADVLTAAAIAGGMERICPKGTDAECGGAAGSCIQATKLCNYAYYKAADGAALTQALIDIGKLVGLGDPCAYKLDAIPSDPKFLTVIVNGVSTSTGPDTWTYDTSGSVKFQGALCTKLSNATPNDKVLLEFRIVEGL